MRPIAVLILLVCLAAGTTPTMAQDASIADLCLHVEASANVDLDDPQSVSSAMASGEISIVDVIDCEAPSSGPGVSDMTGNRFGAWFVSDVRADTTEGGTTAIAGVEAGSGTFASGKPAYLAVRCHDGEVDLIITWYDTLEDEQPVVETQTESLALEALPWNRSMDQSSTFYPGHLLRPFLESMYGMTNLAVSTTPTGKAPLTAIFDIEGIEDALRNIRSACEWE